MSELIVDEQLIQDKSEAKECTKGVGSHTTDQGDSPDEDIGAKDEHRAEMAGHETEISW